MAGAVLVLGSFIAVVDAVTGASSMALLVLSESTEARTRGDVVPAAPGAAAEAVADGSQWQPQRIGGGRTVESPSHARWDAVRYGPVEQSPRRSGFDASRWWRESPDLESEWQSIGRLCIC
mmetsp:Transcript_24958/g.55328  ORF Transcript_24958/g.55328 Transcript_24958/m.55328 type:complete len:121 (-) Transcript_24958:496-858(-)